MSEDEARRIADDEEQQDVEAHRRHGMAANDEGTSTEDEDDNDFEAHRRHLGV